MAASLTAHLKLDRSGFVAGLKGAQKNLAKFARETRDQAFGVAKAGLLGVGVAGAAAGASLAIGVKKAYDLGGGLSDLQARTGILVGDLVVMQQALENAGVSEENLRNGINKMQKTLQDAGEGSKGAQEDFAALGLTFAKLNGMKPKAQFEAVGKAINELKSPTERAAYAMRIFGKSGAEMLTVFSDGKGGLTAAARTIGSQAQILNKNAAKFDLISDLMNSSGKKLQGFYVGVAASLVTTILPVLERFDKADFAGIGTKLGDSLKSGAEILLGSFKDPEQAFRSFGLYLDGTMRQAGNVLLAGVQTSANVFASAFGKSIEGIGRVLMGALMAAFQTPVTWYQAKLEKIAEVIADQYYKTPKVDVEASKKDIEYSQGMARKFGNSPYGVAWQDRADDTRAKMEAAIASGNIYETTDQRIARMSQEGGPRVNIGGKEYTAEDLKQSGSSMLLAGARKGVQASGLDVQDRFGAGAKFAAAAQLSAGLQNTGRDVLSPTVSNRRFFSAPVPIKDAAGTVIGSRSYEDTRNQLPTWGQMLRVLEKMSGTMDAAWGS